MHRSEDKWIATYEDRRALFMHDGNMKRRHVRLRSGLHSAGFFNSRLIIENEQLLREGAQDLLELFERARGDINAVDRVVGPQTGATMLAELLSIEISTLTGRPCFSASPKKQKMGEIDLMLFTPEERLRLLGKTVLLCEDVVTTGGSIERTANAVRAAGGIVLPYVLTLVNRSGLGTVDDRLITSLISRSLPTWTAERCPLCKQSSHAVENPKDNWDELLRVA